MSNSKENIIGRPHYLERIKPFINKSLIKVLTGQRRVGKSFILKQIIEHIRNNDKAARIIFIDKELDEFRDITNEKSLYRYIKEQLESGQNNYLFVDEIQEIEAFEKCLRSLLNEGACDIYCTGSNANLLSGDLATLLGGRHIAIQVHGLSFIEFLDFHQLDNNNNSLNKYLTLGGMPYMHHLGLDLPVSFEYLLNLYHSILLRDVVKRENIRNVSFLENLVRYLADNVGNLFSAQNISKYLKSKSINIPVPTVISYINALRNAFFVYKVPRTEVEGLKVFEISEKYYFEDLGLRNCIRPFNYAGDVGKLLENAVYMHLLQNGYKVFVGKMGDKEIDFVADKNGERLYIQVAYLLANEKIIQREFGKLQEIEDNYPKLVVTMDEIETQHSYKGIKRMHLKEFLMTDLTVAVM
jgi:predicted AAA+ superfamily ATPase